MILDTDPSTLEEATQEKEMDPKNRLKSLNVILKNKTPSIRFYQIQIQEPTRECSESVEQTGRKSTHLTFLLNQCPRRNKPVLHIVLPTPPNWLALLFTSCASICLTNFLSLSMSFHMFSPCQMVACSTSWPIVNFIQSCLQYLESYQIKSVC